MPYNVLLESRAERDLKKLPREIRARILPRILDLKQNPRPVGIKKLSRQEEYYRLRVGDWRVVYEIDDRQKKVNIFRIRHRREAYQNL
jgi:mRNA interferase RelE/StbE